MTKVHSPSAVATNSPAIFNTARLMLASPTCRQQNETKFKRYLVRITNRLSHVDSANGLFLFGFLKMKYRSRFDRQIRLLKRSKAFLKELNAHSDDICNKLKTLRSPQAQKHYDRARRIISDINKELERVT